MVGASEAVAACRLDRLLLMVTGRPWQKFGHAVSAPEHRYAMTVLAAEGRADFEVSRLEIDRHGPTYTYETLESLAAPGRRLVFIAGGDALSALATWERPERVRDLAEFAVLQRSGAPVDHALDALAGADVSMVDMPLIDVSSTAIRARVAAGRPISFLVAPAVEEYIRGHGLYARSGEDPLLDSG